MRVAHFEYDVTELLNVHHGHGPATEQREQPVGGRRVRVDGDLGAERAVRTVRVERHRPVELVDHLGDGRIDRRVDPERGRDVPGVHDDLGQVHHGGRVGRKRAERKGAVTVERAGRPPRRDVGRCRVR